MSLWSRWRRAPVRDVPGYALLHGTQSLTAPPEVLAAEAETMHARHDALVARLSAPPFRPLDDAPLLTSIVTVGSVGFLTIATPEGAVLPMFSSHVRAADYRDSTRSAKGTQYLSSSASEGVGVLRSADESGAALWTLDRCPRCESFLTYNASQFQKPEDLINVWAIARATTALRAEVYVRSALDLAYSGDFRMAAYVVLCAVQHVTMEEPQLHLLLGQISIARGNRTTTHEAAAFLRFLGCAAVALDLESDAVLGTPDFSRIAVPVA